VEVCASTYQLADEINEKRKDPNHDLFRLPHLRHAEVSRAVTKRLMDDMGFNNLPPPTQEEYDEYLASIALPVASTKAETAVVLASIENAVVVVQSAVKEAKALEEASKVAAAESKESAAESKESAIDSKAAGAFVDNVADAALSTWNDIYKG
jgi:hypothetical protein